MINTLSLSNGLSGYPFGTDNPFFYFRKNNRKSMFARKNATFEAHIQNQNNTYENRTPHPPFPAELRML